MASRPSPRRARDDRYRACAFRHAAAAPRRVKLSYKEQRELDALPQRIADLEAEQKTLGEKLADPSTYQNDAAGVAAMNERFAAIEEELLTALERWEALEARR